MKWTDATGCPCAQTPISVFISGSKPRMLFKLSLGGTVGQSDRASCAAVQNHTEIAHEGSCHSQINSSILWRAAGGSRELKIPLALR